jgi:hypothetical protein
MKFSLEESFLLEEGEYARETFVHSRKQQHQGERKERTLCSALLNERPDADRLIYSSVFNNI